MERKNVSSPSKTSGEVLDVPGNFQSNKPIHVNSDSKQMPNTNSNEPKRVIKQIVSLDSKKLKALGIESNILSALTKFNGKEKTKSQIKSTSTTNCGQTSTQTVTKNQRSTESGVQQPASISVAHIPPIRSNIALRIASPQCKSPETPATKKIHVLSNVLLNKNKLDLKEFTAIASSTPVKSTNVAYVPQVPKSSPTKTLQQAESDKIQHSDDTSNISALIDNVTETVKEEACHINTQESDALKGFSIADLKCSQSQFEQFQSEIHSKPVQIQSESIANECKIEPKSPPQTQSQIQNTEIEVDIKPIVEPHNESILSTTNTSANTTSDLIYSSSESSSDSESDLDELIKEAQMTIENELIHATESAEETAIVTKKPRLVKKELLDLLTEHVDKDRLIDEFLDSTINSFRTQCPSPSDSDSSSDENDQHDQNDSTEIRGPSDTEDDALPTSDLLTNQIEEGIVLDVVQDNITVLDNPSVPTASDSSHELLPTEESRKRKNADTAETNLKRMKSEPTDNNTNVQSTEILQDNSTKTMAIKSSAPQKRGRKPKQTVLSEYFAVREVNISEPNLTADESEHITKDAPVKSSRYGRVIKPKSFEIETAKKIKTERKSSKETDSSTKAAEATNIESQSMTTVVKPLKKREHKSQDVGSECDTTSILPNETAATSLEFKLLAARRKSTEKLLAQIESSMCQTASHASQMPEEYVITKRRGRPAKKPVKEKTSINSNIPLNEGIEIDQQANQSSNLIPMCDEPSVSIETTVKKEPAKRRGRKPKNAVPTNTIDSHFSIISNNSNVQEVSIDEINPPVNLQESTSNDNATKKRRRKPKTEPVELVDNQNTQENQSSACENPPIEFQTPMPQDEKKRGRPRIKPLSTLCKPPEPAFKCGNCQLDVRQRDWKAHESTHLGVTWRIGIDEAIDVDDSATQSRIMIRFMKNNKIPYLKCPKCGEKKKSALGYISHVEVCGLTEEEAKSLKEECEFCKKLYRKVSLASHQQSFCTVRRLEQAQQEADQMVKTVCEVPEEPTEEVIYSESGRPKRTIKKIKPISTPIDEFIKVGMKITGGSFKNWRNQLQNDGIIQCSNENCTFTTVDLAQIQSHYKQCRTSINQCKICHQTERSREKIVEHIESMHPDVLRVSEDEADNDDDADFNGTAPSTSSSDDDSGHDVDDTEFNEQSNRSKSFKSLKRKRSVPLKRVMEEECPLLWDMVSTYHTRILNTRPGYYYIKAYEWTKEFMERNYDLNVLALKDHMRCDFEHVRLPQRELNKFLGLLAFKSPLFEFRTQNEYELDKCSLNDANWQKLNLFENAKATHAKNPSSILFCGGKIMTADWIPFPNDYAGNQVLAICAQSNGAKPISLTNRSLPDKCKSLIQMYNISTLSDRSIDSIDLMYAVAYEDGPISTLSFCPSDAYIASKRLAIVAIPDTKGNINIISLPETVAKTKSNVPSVIKTRPDIRLQLGFANDENPPQTVTQIAWSRTKGHSILCASFNTGLVAVWNFEHLNLSYMCKKDSADSVSVIIPKLTFIGSLSFITQLNLHPDSDGSIRWILIGAVDRRIRLYDLYDAQLIPFTSQVFKSRIMSGTWPLHWPIYLTILDAALTRMNGGLHIKHVLYTDNQPRSTNFINDAEPSNLTFSDWLNTVIFGNDAGDLFMINFQQMLMHDRYDESSELKVISCTDLFFDETSTNETNQLPKICFKDFDKTVLAPKMNTRLAPVDQHPYSRITRVAFNPNESHQKLYAVGYELGFCRILSMP